MNNYTFPPFKIEKRTEYTAFMIEPRKHRALHYVLNNFLENLSEEWSIVLLHGTQNVEYVNNILDKLAEKYPRERIQTANLGVENLVQFDYNDLFFNPKLYDYIPTETFIVFHTDSMILRENRHRINDYLGYDYVGANWGEDTPYPGQNGNGGLSLRKKSKMLELLTHQDDEHIKGKIPKEYNCYTEDVYFCGIFHPSVEMKKADYEKASQFSVEANYGEDPFGIHAVWRYHYKGVYGKILEKYPYIRELEELQ